MQQRKQDRRRAYSGETARVVVTMPGDRATGLGFRDAFSFADAVRWVVQGTARDQDRLSMVCDKNGGRLTLTLSTTDRAGAESLRQRLRRELHLFIASRSRTGIELVAELAQEARPGTVARAAETLALTLRPTLPALLRAGA